MPVPRMLHLCEDDSVIGTAFFVMEFVDGTVFWDPALPELTNPQRTKVYDEQNRALAALHLVDPAKVGLADFGKAGSYFARQRDRWTKQYRASETEHLEDMETLITWLVENEPPDDGRSSLVHGDYRLDNMIFKPDGSRLLAVIDWELSTIGHPFSDLAYQCMQWRFPNHETMRGLAGVDRRGARHPDRGGVRRQILRARRHLRHPHLEVLPRLLLLPSRGHRPGRQEARPRRQRLQPREGHQVGRARAADGEDGRRGDCELSARKAGVKSSWRKLAA